MQRTILIILATLLLASSASASFAVYIDDDGPPSDVILATDIVLRANTYTDEIPSSGYTALFSEYEAPADMMLVISDGDVWIVESTSSASLRTALVRAVSELDIEAEYTTNVPEVLDEWEPDANDHATDADPVEDDSEGNETEPSDAITETASDDQTQPAGAQNGSDGDESEESESSEDDEPERGFWGRIAYVLFGWMRR